MKVIFGINRMRKFRKPVVAIGVFDGLHQGHRQILKAAAAKARHINGTGVVLTFWPHPQKEGSLISLEHRLRLIGEIGIDVCMVINFNQRFAKLSAIAFVKNILFKRIGAHYIYVGRNFSFGRNAKGNFETLKDLSKIFGFKLKVFDVIKIENKPISSSYIRALIKEGKLKAAQKLLSHPVSILGTVIRGTSLAKKLGFPTANIDPHHEVIPPSGVYAVKVLLNNAEVSAKLNGICNIGTKPTFKQSDERHIEAYILNFNQNIYGKYLELQFIKKIRDEKKFASPEELAEQIKKDIGIARRIFSRHHTTTISAY